MRVNKNFAALEYSSGGDAVIRYGDRGTTYLAHSRDFKTSQVAA
jgi:hypothetical protein